METVKPPKKNHLIVLLPESLAGSMQLAYKIYSMAALNRQDVLYLVLLEDKNNYLEYSRYMATMKAATSDESLNVVYKISDRNHWLFDLRQVYQPGDIVLCHEEQIVKVGFMRTQSMQAYLQEKLMLPANTLSGFYHPQQEQIRQWMYGLLFWASAIAVLVVFTLLEIQIDHALVGLWRTILLLLVICIEFGVFLVLNRIPKI